MSLKFPVSLVGKRISNWLGFGNASRSFDGVDDYVDFGDSDDFSFGDGLSDSPFSVSAWIKPQRTDKFRVLGKYDSIGQIREWVFTTDNLGQLILFLFDESTNGTLLQRAVANPISNYFNQWVHVSCTYDGSSNSSGIKLYIDGVESQDTDNSAGVYVAMENSTEPLVMGGLIGVDYSEGNISDCRLYDTDLTSTQISNIYNGTDIQTNLVGHWIKDTDDAIDHSVNSNDGRIDGRSQFSLDGPLPSATVFGKYSRDFTGVNDVVDLGNTNARGAAFTACAWVKADTFDASFGNAILSRWNGNFTNGRNWLLWISFVDPLKPEFRILDSSNNLILCSAPSNIVLGQWTHVAGVVDGTNIHLYIDGVLVNTTAFDGTVSTSAPTTTAIGANNYPNTTQHNFDGNICDCRVYDTALTALQIADLEAGTDVQTNLVGHWLRNENNLLDYAGSNNGSHAGAQYDQLDGPAL